MPVGDSAFLRRAREHVPRGAVSMPLGECHVSDVLTQVFIYEGRATMQTSSNVWLHKCFFRSALRSLSSSPSRKTAAALTSCWTCAFASTRNAVSCLHARSDICCNACTTCDIHVYTDLLLVTHTGASVSILSMLRMPIVNSAQLGHSQFALEACSSMCLEGLFL